jgi:transcription elongation factor GreA
MSAEQKYTKEGFKKLQDEYDYLTKVRMEEIKVAIAEARSFGDLSENAEYDEAKNEQTKCFTRIKELEQLIQNAIVVEDSEIDNGVIGLGMSVKITRDGKECEYKIVGSNEADPFENKISDRSPIGAAIIGKKIGDTVYASTNKNKNIEIKILDVFKA